MVRCLAIESYFCARWLPRECIYRIVAEQWVYTSQYVPTLAHISEANDWMLFRNRPRLCLFYFGVDNNFLKILLPPMMAETRNLNLWRQFMIKYSY
jgi:hypothetical protein